MRTGRPSKIDPARIEAIVVAIKLGSDRTTAAAVCGIAKGTLYSWLARGTAEQARLESEDAAPDESEAIYVDFLHAVEQAEALAHHFCSNALLSDKSWRAKLAWLERRYPELWAKGTDVWTLAHLLRLVRDGVIAEADGPASAAVLKLARLRGLLGSGVKPSDVEGMLDDATAKRELESAGLDDAEMVAALDLLERLRGGQKAKVVDVAAESSIAVPTRPVECAPEHDAPPAERPWRMDDKG